MRFFKKIAATLFSLVIVCTPHFAYAQGSQSLLKRCIDEGPANVVNGFSTEDWDDFGKTVASGNLKWVEAAACLYHGFSFMKEDESIDYTAGESDLGDYALQVLNEAWTKILLNNPKPLLHLGRKISFAEVCTYPMWIEKQSIEWVDDYLKKALTALNKIEDDGYMRTAKRECAFYLSLARERVLEAMIDELRR